METLGVPVVKEPGTEDLPVPCYQSDQAAGLDLYAACDATIVLKPGQFRLVPTGIRLALPVGYEGQVRPRSGLAFKHGVTVLNGPGTIDADYRGPVGVILVNLGEKDFKITRGMRIAQLVVSRVQRAQLQLVEKLDDTIRGEGGFGHTGLHKNKRTEDAT